MGSKELKHLEESLSEIPQKKLLLESLEKELANSHSKHEKELKKQISTKVIEDNKASEVKILKAKIKANNLLKAKEAEEAEKTHVTTLETGAYFVFDKYIFFSLGFTFCWIWLILDNVSSRHSILYQYFSNIVATSMVLLLGCIGLLSVNFIIWILREPPPLKDSYDSPFRKLEQIKRRDIYLNAELTAAERRLSGIESEKSDLERNLKSIINIEQKIQDLRIEIRETYESIKHLIPYSNYL